MRETSTLYKTLRNEVGSYYEVEVTNNGSGKTYTASDLKTIKINPMLLSNDGFSIGNTCSAQCKISLIESSLNWPRMSEFAVRVRLSSADNEWKSEWLNMGTFYTDERSDDKYGNLEIIGFDQMLSLEASWYTKIPEEDIPASWPITARAMVDLLKDAFGFDVDNIENVDNSHAFIGLNTTATAREMMRIAAAGCGGNWIVTPDNKFRLVPFVNGGHSSDSSAIAGIAIAGKAVVGVNASGGINGYPFYGETDIGLSAMDFDFSPVFAGVSGVTFTAEDGTVDTYGDDSGYVISQPLEFSRSGTAELALTRLSCYTYRPFDAKAAIVDPAVELGDLLIFNENDYQIASIVWNVSPHITADLSAPYDPEIDHEYPYLDKADRAYQKTQQLKNEYEEAYSEIVQEIGQINIEVAQKVGDDEIISRINLSPEKIVIAANRIDLTGTVTFTDLETPGSAVISGSNITGGTLTLGGYDNIYGLFKLMNADGTVNFQYDKNGMHHVSNGTSTDGNPTQSGTEIDGTEIRTFFVNSSYGQKTVLKNGQIWFWYGNSSGSTIDDVSFKLVGLFNANINSSGEYLISLSNLHSTFPATNPPGISIGYFPSTGTSNITLRATQTITSGNFACSGTKSRIVEADEYGKRMLYCYETPSPLFGDVGEGVLDDTGICYVFLDPVFAETIAPNQYQVFLQKYGKGDCWITERHAGFFVVEGDAGLAFGWELKAKQSDYDQIRMEKEDGLAEPILHDYGTDGADYYEDLMKERDAA